MRSLAAIVALVSLPVLAGSTSDYQSFKRKFQLIEMKKATPGSTVSLTANELNAYVETEVRKYARDGVREPRVVLGNGTAEGYANIDFLKIKRSRGGEQPGWLMRQLLEGERPVFVRTRVSSAEGRAKVDVERVEVNGIPLEGRVLDYLIRNHLHAYFPKAKVGESFPLADGIERLDVKPQAVNVVMAKN